MLWTLLLALFAHFAANGPDAKAVDRPVPLVDSIQVAAFSPHRAPFDVSFDGLHSDYAVMAMFALPRQRIPIAVPTAAGADSSRTYALRATAGDARPAGRNRWTWTAPAKPGLYPIEIQDDRGGAPMTLNVFVMVPYTAMRGGWLNGYHIGAYPRPRRGYQAEYQRPIGFVEVTSALLATPVAPHFTLGQFVCKQSGGYPHYLVLRQPLLVKLEELLEAVNDRGIPASTFAIMSAYRTPTYNAAIGNVTVFSRHEYGDAADVFVDEDHDGVMDDLNHDGRHTAADAHVLSAIVTQLLHDPELASLTGGLGTYDPTPEHGPFMHVDVRGFAVEWGA